MRDEGLPVVGSYPLPEELRSPLKTAEVRVSDEAGHQPAPDMNELCEALTPLISAAIARKTRQRRYTP